MKCAWTIIFSLVVNLTFSQNLIFNGGFEDLNICTELDSECGAEAWFRNPLRRSESNLKGFSKAHRGNTSEIIVIESTKRPIKGRVFIFSMLKCDLVQDEEYKISFWLNPIKNQVLELGVLLSEFEMVPGIKNPLKHRPSFPVKKKDFVKKEKQWTQYEFIYKAKGKERYITIGNFDKEVYCPDKRLTADNRAGDLVYFIDDLSLTPINPTTIECDSTLNRKRLYSFNNRHTYKIGLSTAKKRIKTVVKKKTPPTKTIEIPVLAFQFDSYKLSDNYQDKIESIIDHLKSQNPVSIEIIGHTDDVGDANYNQKLSLKRAIEVKKLIVSKISDYESIITVKGLGEDAPKVKNNSSENRNINRRVEINYVTRFDN